jgi:hypothetical protein
MGCRAQHCDTYCHQPAGRYLAVGLPSGLGTSADHFVQESIGARSSAVS